MLLSLRVYIPHVHVEAKLAREKLPSSCVVQVVHLIHCFLVGRGADVGVVSEDARHEGLAVLSVVSLYLFICTV